MTDDGVQSFYDPLADRVIKDGPRSDEVRAVLRRLTTYEREFVISAPRPIGVVYCGSSPEQTHKRNNLLELIEKTCVTGALFDFKYTGTTFPDMPDFTSLRLPYPVCIFLFRALLARASRTEATHILLVIGDDDYRPMEFITLFWTKSIDTLEPVLGIVAGAKLAYDDEHGLTMRIIRTQSDEERQDEINTANWSLNWLRLFLTAINDNRAHMERVPAPSRLNATRAKKGRGPIPSYWRSDISSYVTSIRAAQSVTPSEGGGGTHASPKPHTRRAHSRRLEDGRVVWVRSTTVNDFAPHLTRGREFYSVKV